MSANRPFSASTAIDLSAQGSCLDSSAIEYEFFYRRSGTSTWQSIRSWGPATAAWDTHELVPGDYELLAEARSVARAGASALAIDLEPPLTSAQAGRA